MKNLLIQISGAGTPEEIANQLKQIASDIEQGNHINSIEEKGKCEWEDAMLFTKIMEA